MSTSLSTSKHSLNNSAASRLVIALGRRWYVGKRDFAHGDQIHVHHTTIAHLKEELPPTYEELLKYVKKNRIHISCIEATADSYAYALQFIQVVAPTGESAEII